MEKRVFLAIVLSFGILAVYQNYIVPPQVAPPAAAPTGPAGAPAALTQGAATPAAPEVAAITPAPIEMPATLVGDTEARDIIVNTDTVYAVFSTEGATIKSWRLKKYFDTNGEPLDLIPPQLPANYPHPFTLATDQDAVSAVLSVAKFKPSSLGPLSLGAAPGTLSFEYQDETGLTARKSFHFQPDGMPYMMTVDASVDVQGVARPVTLKFGPAVGIGYSTGGRMTAAYPSAAVFHKDGSVERPSASSLLEQPAYEGVMRFAGVGDQYFLSAAIPGTRSVRMEFQPVTLPTPEPDATETGVTERSFVSYSVSTPGAMNMPFFVGPKDFDVLKAVDTQLVRAIDFGIFAWLVVPLLQSLKWINTYVGNFGWSIVLLTIILNAIMFPLRHRSMVSMRKMQEIQPEVKAIQKRYEKLKITDPDRQKMNTEMMALYKQRGVNPASGCVPMLLTMPVLFAFYAMLSVAIELRGAPFFGWITDLSQMDPLYITPVLMGVTMFVQQKMTPSTADPAQQKIFMFMPLIFMVMFLWAPAGLVIYWLMSNIMTVGQQFMTNRMIGSPSKPGSTGPEALGGTSAERRAKQAGRAATPKAQGK
ncbi:MAG: membrane protein insertase YidC [Acidobacteria bacterium]|jgi:YidC/Oxa1 family membrane protein insertase|nr:membrane protein insertase YidC [Acidobacteriota bacterium]